MILNIIATVVLAYFIVREAGYVIGSRNEGYSPIWVFIGGLLVLLLGLVLWAVWA